MDSSMVIIFPPVYIIESTERCYKCGKRNKVVTYGSGQINAIWENQGRVNKEIQRQIRFLVVRT